MEFIEISSHKRETLIDITEQVQDVVAQNGWHGGSLLLFCPHTTAALTINENADPDVQRDIIKYLAASIPRKGDYKHLEGNSDAHIKSSLLSQQLLLIVEGGGLRLGTWQSVYLYEGDGPRNRALWLQFMQA